VSQQWLDETQAIIVLYKTPLHASASYRSLTRSLNSVNARLDLFVYDNSPTPDLNIPADPGWKIHYHHDAQNPGISKAYNQGFKKAPKKKWFLLLDQDTQFNEGTIQQYYQSHMHFPQEACFVPQLVDKRGIISPFKFQLGNGIRIKSVSEGILSLHQYHIVNSGIMIAAEAFQRAGGYDEDFPLDFSDYAFVERLRQVHTRFVLMPLELRHHFSATENQVADDVLKRFNLFVGAARLFRKKYYPANLLITTRPLLRALKLSLRFRTLKFVMAYYRS
jgi:rhamnosyltransferase